jgi:hypothetical protein
VDEQAFNRLFELLDELIPVIKDEELISRKAVGLLFHIYVQLETQLAYSRDSQAGPIQQKHAKLLTYLRKVFGDVREKLSYRKPQTRLTSRMWFSFCCRYIANNANLMLNDYLICSWTISIGSGSSSLRTVSF